MAKEQDQLALPRYFPLWALILLMTFFTLTTYLAAASSPYSYADTNISVSIMLFLLFSATLTFGLLRSDKKLLLLTGLAELVIVVLPLFSSNYIYMDRFSPLTGNSWSDQMIPYVISPVFMLTFGVLIFLLPIGLLYLAESAALRKKLMMAFTAIVLLMLGSWMLRGASSDGWRTVAGSYMEAGDIAGYLLVAFVLLGSWHLTYRRIERKPLKGAKIVPIPGFARGQFPLTLFAIALVMILVAGYVGISQRYESPYTCGDGRCDSGLGEWCYQDCQYCGDGVCNSMYENSNNCPADCGQINETATLVVLVTNKVTGSPMAATVTVFETENNIMAHSVAERVIDGSGSFEVAPGKMYFIEAMAPGFSFSGYQDPILIGAGEEKQMDVVMAQVVI